MKFPRRRRLLRNPFDATAYAAVFFLLVIFVLLSSRLYTPGIKIHLPAAADLPGTDRPTLTVAMDEFGRYFFQNQLIEAAALQQSLQRASQQSAEPLTLIILLDEAVRYKNVQALQLLARAAGIHDSLIATTPPAGSPTP
ncbi:MAG TPA: biopolymer transporter ExbD [Verrucomicrobiota bacterium]|nr:biopolymer transporter ExbD [Verrucomicrobiota bacterium]HNT14137.1 biopolymer transporter ExbD [Verrucomicrobiota bacterium]